MVCHGARKAYNGARKVSHGARKVSHGAGKVSHGAGKLSSRTYVNGVAFDQSAYLNSPNTGSCGFTVHRLIYYNDHHDRTTKGVSSSSLRQDLNSQVYSFKTYR